MLRFTIEGSRSKTTERKKLISSKNLNPDTINLMGMVEEILVNQVVNMREKMRTTVDQEADQTLNMETTKITIIHSPTTIIVGTAEEGTTTGMQTTTLGAIETTVIGVRRPQLAIITREDRNLSNAVSKTFIGEDRSQVTIVSIIKLIS